MLKLSRKNLYYRCGLIEINSNIKYDHNNKKTRFNIEVDGDKVPVLNYKFKPESDEFYWIRSICLKTFLGYIYIGNINRFIDIFNIYKYQQDKTQWVKLYDESVATKTDVEKVRQLSLRLGKHWKDKI